MRRRTLVFLLVLTVGDYLLWNWSIAGGHDVVSLVAGLTLLPLAAVSVGRLLLAGGLLLGRLMRELRFDGKASTDDNEAEHTSQLPSTESHTPSRRLAA